MSRLYKCTKVQKKVKVIKAYIWIYKKEICCKPTQFIIFKNKYSLPLSISRNQEDSVLSGLIFFYSL